jgi:hypothetical protein
MRNPALRNISGPNKASALIREIRGLFNRTSVYSDVLVWIVAMCFWSLPPDPWSWG